MQRAVHHAISYFGVVNQALLDSWRFPMRSICLAAAVICACLSGVIRVADAAVPATAPATAAFIHNTETPQQHDARMAWWREAKFGMFIHWGLYAIPHDGEWHMRQKQMPLAEYKKFAGQFNPVKFNADEWASIAQEAGMKYMVLTTKHHDGFAMFHSAASDYNVYDATPFKRDPLKELSLACPEHGIKLGTYYSVIADWGHPGGGAGCPKWDKAQEGNLDDYINNVSLPQVKELLTNYGPIAVMWFDSDGAQPRTAEQAARYAEALKLQPNIIVDPRLHGCPGDFDTAEGHIPMLPPNKDWELCTRTNGSWGYTPAPARPLNALLHELVEAWGKGGNVLLNVGPTAEGIIPPDSVAVLKQIGDWLKTNGTAIYGSKRGPFDYLPWGWSTLHDDTLYLLVFDWPHDGQLKLPANVPADRAWLPSAPDKNLAIQYAGDRTLIAVPAQSPDPNVSVVAVHLTGPCPVVHSLAYNCQVIASDNQTTAGTVVNGNAGGDWRIPGSTGTLEFDLGKPVAFSVLRLSTPYTSSSKLMLEAELPQGWTEVYSDEHYTGAERIRTFAPVTAQHIRLTIIAEKPGIRVADFELFPPL
jgi:alpha-L-fucosidase